MKEELILGASGYDASENDKNIHKEAWYENLSARIILCNFITSNFDFAYKWRE